MSHYFVTAKVTVNPGVDLSFAKAEMIKLVKHTLSEKGCLRFEIRQSVGNDRVFMMWEEFVCKEALNLHFQYEHTKDFLNLKLTNIEYAEFTEDFSHE